MIPAFRDILLSW